MECLLVPIRCHFGCGEHFFRNQMEQHYQGCQKLKEAQQHLNQDSGHHFVVNCVAIEETS